MVSDGKYATVIKVGDFNAGALTQDYLVTHHQANLNQVPSRRSFVEANMVCYASKLALLARGLFHYHLALKRDLCKLWLSRKNCLQKGSGISVIFQSFRSLLRVSECNLMVPCLLSPRSTIYSDKPEDIYNFYLFKVLTAKFMLTVVKFYFL